MTAILLVQVLASLWRIMILWNFYRVPVGLKDSQYLQALREVLESVGLQVSREQKDPK